MEFYQVINNRKTVRELKSDTISDDILERIIAAGIQAPTYNHGREWEFVFLREKEEKENALQFVKAWSATQEDRKAVSELKTTAQKMFAYAMPRQYTMLSESGCLILPFFKGGNNLFHASYVNSLNSFASVWCCIENIFLAATAEGLAYSMRIPVGDEGLKVAQTVHAPEGYMLPCYIGLGYPKENAAVVEQIERQVKDTLHFGKW